MTEKTRAEVREKFAGKEYPIHVIGRHLEVTDAMKSYAVDKLSKVDRFGGNVIDATITMDIQKLVHTVDFIIDVNRTIIKVTGRSENMYASIDQAIDRLQAKLRRYLSRLHEHHTKKLSEVDVNVNVIERVSLIDEVNDQIEEENLKSLEKSFQPHQVVNREKTQVKMLTQEEAIMKMELSEAPFLLYRGQEDQRLKVIYRREDENYGIIEAD